MREIPSCALIRSRSTNITRVHVIYRAGWRRRGRGRDLPAQEGRQWPPLHIYDIVSRGGETYYYSVINQVFLRRGLSAGSVRCSLLAWHPEQTPRRVIDARIWCMERHAASTSLLVGHTVANAREPDYAMRACVRATRFILHTRKIEIFFSGHMTEVMHGNNLRQT